MTDGTMTGETTTGDTTTEGDALLDAAETAFYERGFHSVRMDAIRDAAQVPLRRIYARYPSKEDLLVAVLERRDLRWRGWITDAAAAAQRAGSDPLLAVFDRLQEWFVEPGFRGCAWINVFGELGASAPRAGEAVRRHKEAFRSDLRRIAERAGYDETVADQVHLLAEGAMVAAAALGDRASARTALAAARSLLSRPIPG